MKRSLFYSVACLLIFAGPISAQVPEKIYGKNKILKPNSYYLQQMELWQAEIRKDSLNADAWYNFYRANRNAYIQGEEDNSKNSKGQARFERLRKIVDSMAILVPQSYEYNFVKWLNGNNDLALFPFLEKAHQLSPESPEPLMHLIFYYEIKGDYNKRDENISAYYNTGDYSPGLLNYSYNLLTALDKDALVFTEGDKDTEAILLLTRGKKHRPDVRMLNVNLLLIKEYRERVFRELGITPLDFEPLASGETYEKFQKTIIKHVAGNNLKRPVYAAVTVSSPYTNDINNDLYLTGLARLYSTVKIDHHAHLVKNVEQLFLLDYLEVYFPVNDISAGNVASMNGNYLYPFAALSNYYYSINNNERATFYKKRALRVATDGGILHHYQELFSEK